LTDTVQRSRTRAWYLRPTVWILGVIVVALAVFGVREMTSGPARIAYGEFFNQLAANNIATVTFSGTQVDGKFKAPVKETAANNAGPQTAFRSQVPDLGDPALLPALRKEHIPIAVISSSAYWWGTSAVIGGLAAILLAKPMLLIIGAAFIAGLVRVARGGKMEIKSTLAMLPMFRSFAQQGNKPKESPGNSSPQADRRIAVEDEMTDAAQSPSKRAWYLRPAVWIPAILLVALAVFGVIEMNKGPAAVSYSAFFDQLAAGNVGSVTFAGTQIDGNFKAPVKETAANNAAPQTTFRSQAPTFGDPALLPELRQQHVAIDVVSSSSWLSWLGRLPWPLVLMIAALLIYGAVKLARGDKATTGSALPTHPIMGMVAGMFGKKEQEVSDPPGDHKAPPAA
jgi:ATP-dependent Zn protease